MKKIISLMGMFLLLISLSACNFLIYGDLKLELGAPTVIRCNEDKIKYEVSLESINNEENYYTLSIKYTGTDENKYEFVIKDDAHIDYVRVDDVVIEETKVQSPVLTGNVFVLPLFESEISVDVYFNEEYSDVNGIYIAESSLNGDSNNDGYLRYGIKLYLEN